MSLSFSVYELSTGRIARAMELPDMETAMLNIDPETEGTVAGWHDPERFYLCSDGTIAEYPEKPGPWAVFDYGTEQWTDPRTAEDVEAAEAADLQARREAASLSRAQFIKAVMHAGIVTPAEAADAAKGNVPESLGPAFAAMTEAERAEASIDWSAAQRVDRLHPLILKLADALGVTDQDLDTLFGID